MPPARNGAFLPVGWKHNLATCLKLAHDVYPIISEITCGNLANEPKAAIQEQVRTFPLTQRVKNQGDVASVVATTGTTRKM